MANVAHDLVKDIAVLRREGVLVMAALVQSAVWLAWESSAEQVLVARAAVTKPKQRRNRNGKVKTCLLLALRDAPIATAHRINVMSPSALWLVVSDIPPKIASIVEDMTNLVGPLTLNLGFQCFSVSS